MVLLNYTGKFDATFSVDGSGPHSAGHGHVETITKHAAQAPADAIIVPDSQLLFNGDFKRSGVDLVLSKDHHQLVLHDYFKGEKRAALSSPDGAHLTGDLVSALTGHTEYAQADGSANAGKVIGHVTKLTGSATVIRNGVSIILNNGDDVHKGDVVQSGSDSTLGITFIDGTVFGLSSNARMVLNEMVYDPNGSNNSSLISLVAGTISFVAGETAKHGDMKVDTPVATMGIRGTAVLVEIDFNIPGQGGAPDAKFQVLVEPDGTTGSYILFDKNTLTPIATVNQAGQQINISQGQVSITNAPLPPDVQKLIQDVFTLKFTDNTNPKTFDHFTDTVIPQSLQPIQLANGASAIPIIATVKSDGGSSSFSGPNGPTDTLFHINLPPTVVILGTPFIEGAGTKGSAAIDTASGAVRFADINPGDRPTVKVTFSSFTFQDAQHNDLTATLNAQQLAAIKAVEAPLMLVPDPGNTNIGSVTWTYSLADTNFAFLAPGETLTLTYLAEVDTNYAPFNTAVFAPITITIIGQDLPTITTTSGALAELPGTGNATIDHAGATITFADVVPTNRPVVSAQFTSFTFQDASHHDVTASLTPEQKAAIAAVEASLALVPSATNANNGSVTWSYDVADSKLDFLAAGEVLTLTYTATVDNGHGGVVSTPLTVTITGTNDAPVITAHTNGAVTEDATAPNLTSTGTVSFTDVDLTDTHTVSVQPVGTTLGTLTASVSTDTSNGLGGQVSWTYTVADSATDYLAAGQTKVEHFTVTVSDGHGGTTSQDVAVTITGTDEAPTIVAGSTTATGAISELAATTGSSTSDSAAGSIAFADPDLSDVHTVSKGTPTFAWSGGTLSASKITALTSASTLTLTETDSTGTGSGSVAWNYSAADKTFDFLAVGQTLTVTYAVTIDDGHGGSVVRNVVETITGTNDAPTIVAGSTTATGAFTHDDRGSDSAHGSIAFADVDLSDVHTVSKAGPTFAWSGGTLSASKITTLTNASTFTLNETDSTGTGAGSVAWNYHLADSGADLLAQGQTLTVTYAVTVSDGHGGSTIQNVVVTVTGSFDFNSDPAGVAGSAMNLGLTQVAGVSSRAVTVTGAPLNWTMDGATHNADGSWTVQTNDFSALTITPDVNYVGAVALNVTETWTNADGTAGLMVVSDNVESYAPGSPIFAVAGDDHLTGTGSGNLFVFAQPIGNDIVYNFNIASDKIDLIGFSNIASFADIQGNIADDANGNAVITIGADETITLYGVHAASVTASDFVFNQAPVTENPGTMQIGDGAHMALSGTIDNTGTIELLSTGDETGLLIIEQGITLTGGGRVVLSDSAENVIHGTSADVTLTNVDNNISGSGDLGGGELTLVNDAHGTIAATDASNSLLIDTVSFTNHGTVLANGEGGLEIKGDIYTDGLLEASAGLLKIDGHVIGGGTAVIDGGNIEFVAASDAVVQFSGSSSDTLVLDDASHFTGTVTGFSYGDTIDLAGIDPANVSVSNSGSLEVHYGPGANDYFSLAGNYDPAGFTVATDNHGGTDIVWDHQAPVIETDQVSVVQNSDGTTTIAGLLISDSDPAASTGTFTVAATTGASGAVTTATDSGQLSDINTALDTVTYDPGVAPQSTGHVAVTVTDSFGATDTVNFVFNETETGPNVALQGTAGKDVIFATSYSDTLTGGGGQDQFVFAPTTGSTDEQHTITDFVAGLDKIDLRQFGNIGALSDLTETQQGNDTLITLDGHDSVLLKNVALASLSANDFILHPGNHV